MVKDADGDYSAVATFEAGLELSLRVLRRQDRG